MTHSPRLLVGMFALLASVMAVLPTAAQAQARPEIFVQVGHSQDVRAVAFSPDGRTVVSGSDDKTLKLWDLASGRELRTLQRGGEVYSLAYSPDGRKILAGGVGKALRVWDAESGRELPRLDNSDQDANQSQALAVAFSPDGRLVAAGNYARKVRIWDTVAGGAPRTFSGHGSDVRAVAFSPDGRTLASGSNDQTIRLWEVATGRELQVLRGQGGAVYSVAFSPDGRTLASSGGDNRLRLWDVATGRELRSQEGAVQRVAFSPDGRSIAGAGYSYIKLWDAASGSEVRALRHSNARTIAFSPDGRALASAGDLGNKTVTIWDIATGQELRKLRGRVSEVKSLAFSPDGRKLVTGLRGVLSDDKNLVKLWDVVFARQLRALSIGYSSEADSVAFAPDGRSFAAASYKQIALWDAEGNEIRKISGYDSNSTKPMVAFAADGRTVMSQGKADRLKVYDVASGKEIPDIAAAGLCNKACALSPDGRSIAGTANGYLKLWDSSSGTELRSLSGRYQGLLGAATDAIAFSRDGRTLAAGDYSRLELWELSSGSLLHTVEGKFNGIISAIAFSRDGRTVAVAGGIGDTVVRLLDVSSGREVGTLRGHSDRVHAISFSPDGKLIASAGDDGSVRLWDAASASEKAMLISFSDGEWIAITPDGYYAGSEKADQYVNVRVGNSVFGIDQYREKFYRPDVVVAALGGKAIDGLAQLGAVKPAPLVSIVDTPARVSSGDATVKVQVSDQGGGIGDLRLYINGSAVLLERRNLSVAAAGGSSQVLPYRIRLVPGRNTVRAVAFNADNSMQSRDAVQDIVAEIADDKPALHALVVGIQDYENPRLALKYPVADAQLMAQTLRERSAGLFENVNVVELTGKAQTTKGAIIQALKDIAAKVKPSDLFVFFVASHGTVDEGEYYLITSNVGSLSSHLLKQSAMSQDDLKQLISNVQATKKLVVIDTCNAGKLGEAIQVAMLTRGMSEETAIKVLSRAVGSTIISASTSAQEAAEGYEGHGLFTYVLVEGLRGMADLDKDGFVKTQELVSYVDDRVPVLAEEVFHHKQYPTTNLSGQGFPLTRSR